MKNRNLKKYSIYLILILAACLYRFSFDYHYIGYFNDDAAYILRSQEILSNLTKVISPPYISAINMIGFPILLMPCTFLAHFYSLKLIYLSFMFLLSLLTIYITYYWSKLETDQTTNLKSCLLISFCPLLVLQSTMVMNEIPFMLFCLLTWIILKKWQMRQHSPEEKMKVQIKYIILALFFAIFSFLIRSEGILMVIITLFFFGKEGDKFVRKILLFIGIIILLFASLTFNHWGAMVKIYLEEIYTQYGKDLACLWGNFIGNSRYLFSSVISLYLFYWPKFAGGKFLGPVLSMSVIFLIIVGVIREIKKEKIKPTLMFFLGYMLIHLFWVANDTRYWVPVLPYLMIYLVKGIDITLQQRRIIANVFIVILCLAFITHNAAIVQTSLFNPARPPLETYKWIKDNIGYWEAISSYMVFRDYLYLRRPFITNIPAGTKSAEIISGLRQRKIKYFLNDLSLTLGSSYSRRTVSDHPGPRELADFVEANSSIKKIYENKGEKTVVYQIN